MSSDTVLMDYESLSHSLGARRFSFSKTNPKEIKSVSIDSRCIGQGALFVALAGEKTDGHHHVAEAFRAGASGAIVESSKLADFNLVDTAKSMGKDLLAVDNSLKALQEAAGFYLGKFPKLLKIGITGSSGKTTTKEMAAAIISREKETVMNMGNLNSETGLPLSVFSVRSNHEAGVFELGMNRKGEIAELSAVLKPNIALITNIGSAHIGILGSKQSIAKEKKNIFSHLAVNDAALIPYEDEWRDYLAEGVKGRVIFYSAASFTELENIRSLGLDGTEITWAGEKIRLALPGKHNLADALAAIAIAREVSVGASAIKQGIESVKPMFGRSEILKGRTTVLRDCYNASPEAVRKTLELCDSLEWHGRRIYVLADMLELGGSSRPAHEQLGLQADGSKADMVFLFGKECRIACAQMKKKPFFHSEDIDELSMALDKFVHKDDLVLLKGSRGCALERLTGMLTGQEAPDVS
ncbi:MAG: UDP-N-acetylmuramoyl-tripeptide--D-alanyl-D-alanine ligase [Treponema sp.]|nr:UDP-N-acetylmuramoyl-tripeptide--D-alanyl-D-alanine ligase [Treponema sp.]